MVFLTTLPMALVACSSVSQEERVAQLSMERRAPQWVSVSGGGPDYPPKWINSNFEGLPDGGPIGEKHD